MDKRYKKITFILLILSVMLLTVISVSSQENISSDKSVNNLKNNLENIFQYSDSSNYELGIHLFIDERCTECEMIKEHINSLNLEQEYKDLIVFHNIVEEDEMELYLQFKNSFDIKTGGYPILFAGCKYLIGTEAIKKNIEEIVYQCNVENCPCPQNKIKGITPNLPKKEEYKTEKTEVINLPLIGDIEIGKMPLFLMTGLIAFVDGFNPCSLWVLTFLLGLVIYSGSRKRIFLIGTTFLLVTATTYGIFMLGLLNVFSYVGFTFWIKLLVSILATIFAIVNIKDYFWYKKGISFTIPDKYKPKLFKKVRHLMDPSHSTSSLIIATIIMALGIVLVELPCTAGFPMVWTSIMSEHNVSGITFASLFLMYISIYLLIEIIIFISAVVSLKQSKFEGKHGRILKLVGGIIMLALAIALLFFPNAMNSIEGTIYIFLLAGIVSFIIIYLHRKILPKIGIKIGDEKIKKNKVEEQSEEKENKDYLKNKDGQDE